MSLTNPKMLYISFSSTDCPNMFLYRYFWFTKEWFYTFYCITRVNLKHLQFGMLFTFISKTIHLIFNNHKSIMEHYNFCYQNAFETYVAFRNS